MDNLLVLHFPYFSFQDKENERISGKLVEENGTAKLINFGLEKFIDDAFSKEEITKDILEHYQDENLSFVALREVRFYEEHAFLLTHLADHFAARLSVPGMPSIEIAPLFEEIAAEAERLLKLARSAHSLSGIRKEPEVIELLQRLGRYG